MRHGRAAGQLTAAVQARIDAFTERARARLAAVAHDPTDDDPALWAERRLGYVNPPHLLEWYRLLVTRPALCLVAPRDHGKSEACTIVHTAWRSRHPGHQTYVFAATDDLATKLKARIDAALEVAAPELIIGCPTRNEHETTLTNGATITAAGAGKAVRGAHPDLIVGDDVLDEDQCRTHNGREKVRSWWFGTVEGMRHPGTKRRVNGGDRWFEPTRVCLVGTPFHADDLLMGMRGNPGYTFRRYAAEYDPDDLVPGTYALEASDVRKAAA